MIRTFLEETQLVAAPSGWLDVSTISRFVFYAADASTGVKVEQAKDGSGTDAKDVSGTSVTATGAAAVEVDAQMLDIENGYRYVKMTGATLFVAVNPDGGPKTHTGVTTKIVVAEQSW